MPHVPDQDGRGINNMDFDLFSEFELLEYLDDRRIGYSTSGKNISSGWIGLTCPYCDDASNHFGINLEHKSFNCWRCGRHGSLITFIMLVDNCRRGEAWAVVKEYQGGYVPRDQRAKEPLRFTMALPAGLEPDWPGLHWDYLVGRGFDPEVIIPKYKLRACYTVGKYKYTIIIPIFLDGKLVNFQAMDVTRQKKRRYESPANKDAVMPAKACLYNLDTVQRVALIVEGATDVWRFGEGTVCTFGTEWTDEQVALLVEKELRSVFIMFDPEATAQRQAQELEAALVLLVPHVQRIELAQGDPAMQDEDTVSQVRKIVFAQ